MKIKKIENKIINIVVVSTFVMLIFFSIYLFRFGIQGISNNQETFGMFGDYIGGVSNLIFGFCNLIVTIFIAYSLNNYDNKRNKNALKFQITLFERELMENSYKEFNKIINSNTISPYETEKYLDYLYDLHINIIYFFQNNSHIFKSINEYNLGKRTSDILNQLIIDLDEFNLNKGVYNKERKRIPEIFKEKGEIINEINTHFINEIKNATQI